MGVLPGFALNVGRQSYGGTDKAPTQTMMHPRKPHEFARPVVHFHQNAEAVHVLDSAAHGMPVRNAPAAGQDFGLHLIPNPHSLSIGQHVSYLRWSRRLAFSDAVTRSRWSGFKQVGLTHVWSSSMPECVQIRYAV